MTVWNVELYRDDPIAPDHVETLCSCEDEDWANAIAEAIQAKVFEGYTAHAIPRSLPTV